MADFFIFLIFYLIFILVFHHFQGYQAVASERGLNNRPCLRQRQVRGRERTREDQCTIPQGFSHFRDHNFLVGYFAMLVYFHPLGGT